MKKLLLFICVLLGFYYCSAQRVIFPLNESWQFSKTDQPPKVAADWQTINLPHTWNAEDVLDDKPGYYRGIGWYKKTYYLPATLNDKKLYLYFEGVNQVAEVFVNGKKAGGHIGGYTGFRVPVTGLLHAGENELLIKVDNSANEDIPPLDADFSFYGGIYRQVYLMATSETHFTTTDHGSNAVFLTTPSVSTAAATLEIRGSFVNESAQKKQVRISSVVWDKQLRKVAERHLVLSLAAKETKSFLQKMAPVKHPKLWSPDDPYLYKVTTSITDIASGKMLDDVQNTLGFRWFHFDAEKGFSLNGKFVKIIGASRHQDYSGLGNAVPKALARRDIELMKQAGLNFLRVAHYPQDPAIMQACDELGLLTSVEIPVVNEITESKAFYDNCLAMQVEMIRQNYNHPSVIIWCYMNEILLRPHFPNDSTRQKAYFSNIEALARSLDSLTRKEDPARYTMIAHHGNFKLYQKNNLTELAMITGWNIYSGWYGGQLEDFGGFLDQHHKTFPKQPFMITEYGADADPRIRSNNPLRFDKSIEYATKFHQAYIGAMLQRPYVLGGQAWNFADFNSEFRGETMPHMNNKGMLTWDRRPKNIYYLYQANLLKTTQVKILAALWPRRTGTAAAENAVSLQPLSVASNLERLALSVNGNMLDSMHTITGLATWMVPFAAGKNIIVASGQKNGRRYADTSSIDFVLQPFKFDKKQPVQDLNIMLGSTRFFAEEHSDRIWMPEQAYYAGSWGYTGGKPYVLPGVVRLPYGSDRNIIGTPNDPVYQTQRVGIEQFRFDVPDGRYELTLHFAELQAGIAGASIYNLSDSSRDDGQARRSFDVTVNGTRFLDNFNIATIAGPVTALSRKSVVQVSNGQGILVNFIGREGQPVLNAIQLHALPSDH